MPTRPDATAKAAMALYGDAPAADRAHVRGRWWTAPFAAVEAALPERGRILEIGCGHGLFLAYAALRGPERELSGVDIDVDKIAVGTRALTPLGGRVTLDVGRSGWVPDGPWDAIVILDVLYLLPAEEQRSLLRLCAAQLAPGGRLLVKEMDMDSGWKARWNRTQETLAVKVLRITEGHDFDFVASATMGQWLEAEGLSVSITPMDAGYPHPHLLVEGRRPTA